MGLAPSAWIHKGPPKSLMLHLAAEYSLDTFIETGTYRARTAVWASSHFDSVVTIERCRELYEATRAKYQGIQNIDFLFGDSRCLLPEAVSQLQGPAIFWLDAHWSGGETWGKDDECPVLDEIRSITNSEFAHLLFIDDARLFLAPPPLPLAIDQWPSLDRVILALKSGTREYYMVVVEDVIVAVPHRARVSVANYCQALSTERLRQYVRQKPVPTTKSGLAALAHGLGLASRGLKLDLGRFVSRKAGQVTDWWSTARHTRDRPSRE